MRAWFWLALALPMWGAPADWRITTVAGSDRVGDGGPAQEAQIGSAEGVAADSAGNVYIADAIDHRVRKVSASGLITTLCGDGQGTFGGDGGPAAQARIQTPYGLAVDRAGSVLLADLGNGRVRRIGADGVIRTVAGGGQGSTEALSAKLSPRNLAVAPDGTVYLSDFAGHRVYRVSADGSILPVAGTGAAGFSGDGRPAASAQLSSPAGLALDSAGALYIADSGNHRVRKVEGGTIRTVLGGEASGSRLSSPTGLAVDAAGNLYVADSGNKRVVKLMPPDAFVAIAAFEESPPRDVALDGLGNLLVAAGKKVYRISPSGLVAHLAGNGFYGFGGDGGPAAEARFFFPNAVALDEAGNLFISDQRNYRVRKVAPSGIVTTIAGVGIEGSSGDHGVATAARLFSPSGVAAGPPGAVWIADDLLNRVRRVDPDGAIRPAAGTGVRGAAGDGGPAALAQLFAPCGLAADRAGNVYVADSLNHRVRRITPGEMIATVAGRGLRGFGGDGGPALEALLDQPKGVAVDARGNLYIAEWGNHRVRKVTPEGVISTVAGSGLRAFGGDGGPAAAAHLNQPAAVAADQLGNLFIADSGNHRIRVVNPEGIIDTLAGDGTPGFSGDGGAAPQARLNTPMGLAADNAGNLYVADFWNHRIRKLSCQARVEPPAAQIELKLVNAASLLAGPVAPGELISILGADVGTAGAEVLFDGAAAPVLYAKGSQVNAQAPYRLAAGALTEVELRSAGKTLAKTRATVAAAAPALFTLAGGTGQAVAVHEDGSLNGEKNPAPRGSVVVLYATGEGRTAPESVEGVPASAPLPKPVLPVWVTVGGYPADVLFAGSAPGFSGLMQINVRLPSGYLPAGVLPLLLQVGSAASQAGVTLALR